MDNNYIDKIILYDLFFRKPISNVTLNTNTQSQSHDLTPIKQKTQSLIDLLSPDGKLLYERAHKDDQAKLLEYLVKDTRIVENMEIVEYMNDPDYQEKMENHMLGFYMENFISCYGICPVCGQNTLRKYSMSNMPVVDLICINFDYHFNNGGCFLYQVKTAIDSNYFTKTHVTVGSKRFGYNSHIVKGNDDNNKKFIVIGYICLYLTQDENKNDNTKYKIKKSESFILIPDLENTLNEHYYSYGINSYGINSYGKNIIRWNSKLVKLDKIDKCISKMNVNKNEQFDEIIIKNPYKYIPSIKLGSEWTKYENKKNKPVTKQKPNPNKKFKLTTK